MRRCLHTATEVLKDIAVNATNVEEYVRETLGEDTCDARRSVSDPNIPNIATSGSSSSNRPPRPGPKGPCSFDKGLSSTYPHYKYRVSSSDSIRCALYRCSMVRAAVAAHSTRSSVTE